MEDLELFRRAFCQKYKIWKQSNVTVLGYVPTNWGTRNIDPVEADILTYHEWYRVNGTYLDQMPNWEYDGPQGQWYYPGPDGTYIPAYFSTLTHYAKSLGETFVPNALTKQAAASAAEHASVAPMAGTRSLGTHCGSCGLTRIA